MAFKCLSKQFFSHVGTQPSLPGYYQYFSWTKCVFAQGNNTALVGIEPRPLALELGALPLGHLLPLQVMRTYINAWTSSYFGQFKLLTPELSALERLKNLCIMLIPLFCAFIFDRIFVILAGKEDSHKGLDEFKFSPDPFSDCGVSCP